MELCMNFSIGGSAAAFSGSAMAYLSERTSDTVRDYIHLKVAGSRTWIGSRAKLQAVE